MSALTKLHCVSRQASLFSWQTAATKLALPHTRIAVLSSSTIQRSYQEISFTTETSERLTKATDMTQEDGSVSRVLREYKAYRLSGDAVEVDWVKDLDVAEATSCFQEQNLERPLKVLVLYGSLRATSYSRLLAREFARILDKLGADVRIYNPEGLPIKDDVSDKHPKVAELRELSQWSEAHVWCCPEQHGTISAVFKNQIDWIPLSLGSVRPTQGRTLAVAQVNGGSQSFNVVNTLRILGRWMRMVTIPNQSSVPKAWTEFDSTGRMKASSLRDRVVDVAEELYKFSMLLRDHSGFLVDRYSERKEKREKGRLLSQAEKEAEKIKDLAAKG